MATIVNCPTCGMTLECEYNNQVAIWCSSCNKTYQLATEENLKQQEKLKQQKKRETNVTQNYKEVRGKLGFFGFVSRLVFLGWQALMVGWFLSYTAEVAPIVEGASTAAQQFGANLGVALSWGLILFFWVGGSIILGMFVLFSRPPRMLVPSDDVKR